MQKLLTTKTVSLTDLRNPMKVIKEAGRHPVAIFNRNKVVGYFVPEEATAINSYTYLAEEAFNQLLAENWKTLEPVLAYLKDK